MIGSNTKQHLFFLLTVTFYSRIYLEAYV